MPGLSLLPARAGSAADVWSATLLRALVTVSILTSLACDSAPTELADTLHPELAKGGPDKNVLVIASGDGQTAPAGTELPQPLVVRVESGAGDPVVGFTIEWAVREGGGSLSTTGSVTNAEGEASTRLTLGSTAGPNEVSARGRRLREVRLSATATESGGGGDPGGGGSGDSYGVTVTPSSASIEVDETAVLSADVVNQSGDPVDTATVDWSSLDPSVASVASSGVVTGTAEGTAEIVASYADGADTAAVTVSEPPGGGGGGGGGGGTSGGGRAFPGADGWGATALEACRSKPLQVLRVTNTNSDGSGSFAQAVADVRSDRFSVIVFETGGHIVAPSSVGMRLSASCVYIAGQTAPGDGIVIEGRPTAFWLRGGGDDITDVVMRYLRFRGKSGLTQNNMIIAKGQRVVLDHMSFSWTDNYPLAIIRYGGTSFSGRIADLSIQHSIVSEAFATHATGLTISTNSQLKPATSIDMTNISIHRNLFAGNSHRNPMTAADNALVANNVIYNWRLGAGMMNRRGSVDWVNNFAKPGPMTGDVHTYVVNPYCDELGGDFSIYAAGNVGPRSSDPNGDNWSGSTRQVSCYRGSGDYDGQEVPPSWRRSSEQPWRAIPNAVALRTAEQAFDAVVADVGANKRLTCDGRWTAALDPVDSRVISETRNGSGPSSPPSDEGVMGGYPAYSRGTGCTDQDADGLPDAWEQRFYGCQSCADPAAAGRDGYLLMEHYLNGTDPT